MIRARLLREIKYSIALGGVFRKPGSFRSAENLFQDGVCLRETSPNTFNFIHSPNETLSVVTVKAKLLAQLSIYSRE